MKNVDDKNKSLDKIIFQINRTSQLIDIRKSIVDRFIKLTTLNEIHLDLQEKKIGLKALKLGKNSEKLRKLVYIYSSKEILVLIDTF